jgi:hypothetical protein
MSLDPSDQYFLQKRVQREDYPDQLREGAGVTEREQAKAGRGRRSRPPPGAKLPEFASLEQLLGEEEHGALEMYRMDLKSADELLGRVSPRPSAVKASRGILDRRL